MQIAKSCEAPLRIQGAQLDEFLSQQLGYGSAPISDHRFRGEVQRSEDPNPLVDETAGFKASIGGRNWIVTPDMIR